MNEAFYIENIENFIENIRKFSFEKFVEINNKYSKEDFLVSLGNKDRDIDSVISLDESKNIIMPMIKKYKSGYKVYENKIYKIIEKLNSRMVSNSLANLVSLGILESAFDSELNDFVFWEKQ